MTEKYEHLFSKQAAEYSRYRFGYPAELYEYIASQCKSHELAWDCATGSGQAAVELADHFDRVIATDISQQQLGNAKQHPRVSYAACAAERSILDAKSADAVTVAQAIHWFDHDAFYSEVRRVVKPGGIIAVWSYHEAITKAEVREVMRHYYFDVVGAYWADRVPLVEKKYETLPFPFEQIEPPQQFSAKTVWSADDLIGYWQSWSSTQAFIAANGTNPIDMVKDDLYQAWGDKTERLEFSWPLALRIGRI